MRQWRIGQEAGPGGPGGDSGDSTAAGAARPDDVSPELARTGTAPPTETFQDQSGRVIGGRYRLESLLGKGGMGAVYEATQLDLGRKVALKMITAGEGRRDGEVQLRFERE